MDRDSLLAVRAPGLEHNGRLSDTRSRANNCYLSRPHPVRGFVQARDSVTHTDEFRRPPCLFQQPIQFVYGVSPYQRLIESVRLSQHIHQLRLHIVQEFPGGLGAVGGTTRDCLANPSDLAILPCFNHDLDVRGRIEMARKIGTQVSDLAGAADSLKIFLLLEGVAQSQTVKRRSGR